MQLQRNTCLFCFGYGFCSLHPVTYRVQELFTYQFLNGYNQEKAVATTLKSRNYSFKLSVQPTSVCGCNKGSEHT